MSREGPVLINGRWKNLVIIAPFRGCPLPASVAAKWLKYMIVLISLYKKGTPIPILRIRKQKLTETDGSIQGYVAKW